VAIPEAGNASPEGQVDFSRGTQRNGRQEGWSQGVGGAQADGVREERSEIDEANGRARGADMEIR
jgi:hypothetical protein